MNTQATLEAIRHQEAALTLPAFSHNIAWQIGSLARDLAQQRGLVLGIQVRRAADPVFLTLMDGMVPNALNWLRRKSNTTLLFDRSTYGLNLHLAAKDQTLARHALSDADYASDGGGFPLRVQHAGTVGTLAISGLDQRSDHEFAVEVLCLHLHIDYATLALPAL